jgi:hypothetical protein
MTDEYGACVAEENEEFAERPALVPLFSSTNPTWTALGLNPELRNEELTTKGQSSV